LCSSAFQPGLERIEQKRQQLFFGNGIGCGARLDGAFLVNRSRSTSVTDACDDPRPLTRRVEGELDEVDARTIRGEPRRVFGSEQRKQLAVDAESVGKLFEERRGHGDKRVECALSLGNADPAGLGPLARGIRGGLETIPDVCDFQRAPLSTMVDEFLPNCKRSAVQPVTSLPRRRISVKPFIAVFCLLFPALVSGQQLAGTNPEPLVVVTGEGIVQGIPDRAWISVGAESRASTARDAQRRNAELMTPILDKIKTAGIPADAIRTIGYDVQYEWDYVNNKRVGRGYLARNTVEIRVDNIDRVGELLELAAGTGATTLGGVRFDFKDRAKLERDALRLAVVDARGKAEAVAAGAGRQLDRLVRVEQRSTDSSDPRPMPMLRAAAAAADAPPPISAGQIEIRADVTLTMSMK